MAAVALNYGWSDPLALLALSPGDQRIAQAVLAKAIDMRVEYDKSIATYNAQRTANLINPVLVKSLTRLMRWIGRRTS